MKRVLYAMFLLVVPAVSFAQSGLTDERPYYIDVSAGYAIALPPFSNAATNAVFLKPHGGGTMSFSLARKVGDGFGVQVEVLTALFDSKKKDLVDAYSHEAAISQVNLDPYRTTFFGAGVVAFFPFGRFTLDAKGSIGGNMVEFAKQSFTYQQLASDRNQSITVSSKRVIAPGILVGGRLRYPIGTAVDIGFKVEYGLSYANFKDVKRISNVASPDDQKEESLPSFKRTISYLNTGLTLGLRF